MVDDYHPDVVERQGLILTTDDHDIMTAGDERRHCGKTFVARHKTGRPTGPGQCLGEGKAAHDVSCTNFRRGVTAKKSSRSAHAIGRPDNCRRRGSSLKFSMS